VIIELISLGVAAEVLKTENRLKMGIFEGTGSAWSKISVTWGHPPPTILCVSKLDEWAFSMVSEFWQKFVSFYHDAHIWRTDRWTGRF